jgi:hypothetical protein
MTCTCWVPSLFNRLLRAAVPPPRRGQAKPPGTGEPVPKTGAGVPDRFSPVEGDTNPSLPHAAQRLKARDVAHLAPRPSFALAVEVELDLSSAERRRPVGLAMLPKVAQEVCHRRRAQEFRRMALALDLREEES